jgi:ATP-dependent Clp protease adaptor protein ClpS
MSWYTQTEEEVLIDVESVEERKLIIYNDDVNTFDHVIECLVDICQHEWIQAEQCTLIIHYKGKCLVKSGEYDKLEKMCNSLHDRGLTAEIQ